MEYLNAYVVGGDGSYYPMLKAFGYEITTEMEKAHLVVFTGGADVSPSLYSCAAHKQTSYSPNRDMVEQREYVKAKALGIPMLGICRGGQFLNVMNGGIMYQHVSDHCGDHLITDVLTGFSYVASSTHHQMMKPAKNALLVAYSTLQGTREWFDGVTPCQDVSDQDIEVIYYEESKCLCFQPHPEFSGYVYLKEYLHELLSRLGMK